MTSLSRTASARPFRGASAVAVSLLAAASALAIACSDDASPSGGQAAAGAAGSAQGGSDAGGKGGSSAGQSGGGTDQGGGRAGSAGQPDIPVERAWSTVDLPEGVTSMSKVSGANGELWGLAAEPDDEKASSAWHWKDAAWEKSYTFEFGLGACGASGIHAMDDGSVWIITSCTKNKVWSFDGSSWSEHEGTSFGVTSTYAVWGTSGEDVWVGSQTNFSALNLNHFDGKGWDSVSGAGKEGVFSFSGDEKKVWLVGGSALYAGDVDGVKAVSTGLSKVSDVWAGSATDVFAVGEAGGIAHFDGKAWSEQTSGTEKRLSTVWGFGPKDVWAGGTDSNTVRHYDGKEWSDAGEGAPKTAQHLFGGAKDEMWAVSDGKLFRLAPK